MKIDQRKRKLLIGGGIGVILLGAAAYWFFGSGVSAETAVVDRGLVEDVYTEEGTLSFGKEYLVIAEVSGPVEQILVQENQTVKKGQTLLLLNASEYEYEKEAAKSELAGYEAQLEESHISQVMTASPQEYLSTLRQELEVRELEYRSAKTVYDGSQALYSGGSISRMEWEAQEASYQAALSAWLQAKGRYEESCRLLEELREKGIDELSINSRFYNSVTEQLESLAAAKRTEVSRLEEQIRKCEIKAEYDGIVTAIPASGMSMLQSGDTAVTLNRREGVRAEADVLMAAAPYIREGMPVEVVLQLRGKEETYSAQVSQIYDYASKGTSALGLDEYRVHVKAELQDAAALEGKEGYGVNIRFPLFRSEDCLRVPSGAVFKSDGKYYVYGIRFGRAEKLPIEPEYRTAAWAAIASGLEEGDKVIAVVDTEEIYEGVRVRGRER